MKFYLEYEGRKYDFDWIEESNFEELENVTGVIGFIFDENKTSLNQIASNVTDVGHDTKSFIASKEAYESLDPCCKYRDEAVVEDHK